MKKCGMRLCIPNLTWQFYITVPSWVFQLSCCVSSLLSLGTDTWNHDMSCYTLMVLVHQISMDNGNVQTMNKWAIEPLDVVAVWIHDHYLITEDRHWEQEHSTQWHCKGEITQPKPEILKEKNVVQISRSNNYCVCDRELTLCWLWENK